MKRIIIFVLTAVILLSMGGCTKKKADNTVEVFCLNMDVTSSVPESYVLRSKNSDVDKQVDELLGRLQDKPEDSRLRKAIPDEVSVRGHDEKTITALWISARSIMTLRLRRRCFESFCSPHAHTAG
ncbi:MAG: hypothetical protein ACLRI8_09890 [Agathobacter rectalis]